MSFFNSLHFLLAIGLSTALYFAILAVFPKMRPEYPLLALSFYWLNSFLNVPVGLVIWIIASMTAFYFATLALNRIPNRMISVFPLVGWVLINWLALRFPETATLLHIPNVATSSLIRSKAPLFVGVPFTVCRMISFVVDLNRGKITNPQLLRFLLFIFYFPARISGPITTYRNFELRRPDFSRERFFQDSLISGMRRIIIGVLKREVVSEILSAVALPYLILGQSTRWQLVLGAYAYYAYLYVDFSGYSDLAIGFSRVLCVDLPENFDRPYLARNPIDFWRRWHISLLNWLNEYVLTPLYTGVMALLPWAPHFLIGSAVIFVTMTFGGVWHGEEERYLYYGIFNSLILIAYRSFDTYMRTYHFTLRRRFLGVRAFTVASQFLCFHYVVVALMIFSLNPDQLLFVLRKVWHG